MAGAMRKMAVYLGLVEDEYEDDTYSVREDHQSAPQHRPSTVPVDPQRSPARPEVSVRPSPAPQMAPAPATVSVTERPTPRPAPAPVSTIGVDYPISTLHPRSYKDARRIGEEYREGLPVIIDLTGMDDSDAKRIVDFAAGLIFGLRGTIERMTNKVFLLSPAGIDCGAQARTQIAQDGFFNQS